MTEGLHAPDDLVPPLDRARQWQLVSIVLGVLLVIAVVTLVVLASSDTTTGSTSNDTATSTAERLRDAEDAANNAARAAAVHLTTYDYSSLDQDFSWVGQGGTTAFQARYAEVSAPIRSFVLQIKAHAVGTVVASAADATDADHVTVLLFVDQAITNQTNSDHKLDQPRMSMSMVRQGGRWLVDDVKINNLTNS